LINQLSFEWSQNERRTLILHSGNRLAVELVKKAHTNLGFFIQGDVGIGKTTLIKNFSDQIVRSLDSLCLINSGPEPLFTCVDSSKGSTVTLSLSQLVTEIQNTQGIVITSRFFAEELTDNPHLLSRIKGMLYCELSPPLEEELSQFIKELFLIRGLDISPTEIAFLATRISKNPKDISKIVGKVDTNALSSARLITKSLFYELFQEE